MKPSLEKLALSLEPFFRPEDRPDTDKVKCIRNVNEITEGQNVMRLSPAINDEVYEEGDESIDLYLNVIIIGRGDNFVTIWTRPGFKLSGTYNPSCDPSVYLGRGLLISPEVIYQHRIEEGRYFLLNIE